MYKFSHCHHHAQGEGGSNETVSIVICDALGKQNYYYFYDLISNRMYAHGGLLRHNVHTLCMCVHGTNNNIMYYYIFNILYDSGTRPIPSSSAS